VALKTTQIGHNRVTARSIKFRKKIREIYEKNFRDTELFRALPSVIADCSSYSKTIGGNRCRSDINFKIKYSM
jgi:MoaA/NifB/PqqE/SkfB family radical SAM enzyme